jgi:hypothetical protein
VSAHFTIVVHDVAYTVTRARGLFATEEAADIAITAAERASGSYVIPLETPYDVELRDPNHWRPQGHTL